MSEKIEPFDYGNIKQEHKVAAEEIAALAYQIGQPMLAELIKLKFEIVEIKKYDLEQSEFLNSIKSAGIPWSVQGAMVEGEGVDKIQYPLITINQEIRTLDAWFKSIK